MVGSPGDEVGLRSKRFQSSYCAKVREEAKKRLKGEGEGRRGNACPQTPRFWRAPLDISRFPFPSPVINFFLLLSQLSRRTSRGNACYAGYTCIVLYIHSWIDRQNKTLKNWNNSEAFVSLGIVRKCSPHSKRKFGFGNP